MSTAPAQSPSRSDKILFWASFFTLIAAGIGFSVRGVEILKDWGNQFGFTQTELGTITGGGLIGFGLAIIFFSFFADRFGYGKLMVVAFLLHASSAVVTFAATPVFNQYGKEGAFYCLNLGMWLFALGNGTCEAVINPLTATLFPRNKTHWLNILHAGWPAGLILGAVIMLGFKQFGGTIRWEYKLGVFLIPVLIYGLLMLGRPFPKSEAKSAGVPMSDMMKTVGMLGFTLAAALIGMALANFLPSVLGPFIKVEDRHTRHDPARYRLGRRRCDLAGLRVRHQLRPRLLGAGVPVPDARPGRVRRTRHRQLDHEHHQAGAEERDERRSGRSSGPTC